MVTLEHFKYGGVVLTPLVGDKFVTLSSDKRLYRKELVKVGDYVHDVGGYEFSITPDILQHWADTFAAMKANGVKVPIPSMHSGVEDPDKNRGYVTDMFVDGESLTMTCELIGKDAIAAAARSDVSIGVPVDWVDGKGNKYLRPITHVALVTDPVIPGLSDFIPLAASRSHKEKHNVDKFAELVKALELTEKVTADNMVPLVLAHHKSQLAKITALETKLKDVPVVKVLPAVVKDVPVDPVLLSLAADNRTMKLDALVSAAKITPEVRKGLAVTFIGEGRKALTLSLKNGQDVFDDVIKLFAENDPVKLAETTRAQVLELSGVGGGNEKDKDVLVADAKARAKAAVPA